MYFHVTNHTWVANTKRTSCNLGVDFFSASAVIWIFAPNSSFYHYYFLFNLKSAAIEYRNSCILFYMIILVILHLWQMAFLIKWSVNEATVDACKTRSVSKSHEKTNYHMTLIAYDPVIVSFWCYASWYAVVWIFLQMTGFCFNHDIHISPW